MKKVVAFLLSAIILTSSCFLNTNKTYAQFVETELTETRFDNNGIFQLNIGGISIWTLNILTDIGVDLSTWTADSSIFVTKNGRAIKSCIIAQRGSNPNSSKVWKARLYGFNENGVMTDGIDKLDIKKLHISVPMDDPKYAAATLIASVMLCDPNLSKEHAQDIIVELTETVYKDQKNTHVENGICYVLYSDPIFENTLVFEIYLDTNKYQENTSNRDYSDNAFLHDLETAVLERLQRGNEAESKEIAKKEYDMLKKYENTQFENNDLKTQAITYLDGLKMQVSSLNQRYHNDQQMDWVKGQLKRYCALTGLYNNYGFLKNNKSFHQRYIESLNEITNYQYYIEVINKNLLSTLDQGNGWIYSDEHTLCHAMNNNTGKTISIRFYYEIYSEKDNSYIMTKDYIAKDIPPASEYNIYFNIHDVNKEDLSFLVDWEILSIN